MSPWCNGLSFFFEAEERKDPVDYRFFSWCTFLSSSQSWRDAKPLLSVCQTSGLLMKRHSNLISTCGVLHSHAPDVATLADVTPEPSDFLLLSVGYERISSIRLVSNNNKKTFWVCWRGVLNEQRQAVFNSTRKRRKQFCACLTAFKKARNFEPSDRLRHRLDWLMVSEKWWLNVTVWRN